MRARGIVAAGSKDTASAGAALLAQGGNAVDAAVAACFATTIAEPMLSSIAAAGVMVIRAADGAVRVLDFFADAPLGWQGGRSGEPVCLQFGAGTVCLELGAGAAAVPGLVPGLCEASERFGRLGLRAAVAPAIALGRDGIVVDDWLAHTMAVTEPILRWSDEGAARFTHGGELIAPGTLLRAPLLADFLEELGRVGVRAYETLARAMADRFGPSAGGHLAREDFERYRVQERDPAELRYRDAAIFCVPDPGASHRALETILGALSAREAKSAPGLDEVCAALESVVPGGTIGAGHTTHMSAIDADGMAVAVTVSHGAGAGLLVPGTESMMNGILGEEHVRAHGAGLGGARLSTMMCPTIACFDGAIAVLGTGGSERIPALVAQVLCRLVGGEAPGAAVAAPRAYVDATTIYVEGAASSRAGADGRRAVVACEASHGFFGGVHVALRHADGRLEGAGDARRGGAAVIAE